MLITNANKINTLFCALRNTELIPARLMWGQCQNANRQVNEKRQTVMNIF